MIQVKWVPVYQQIQVKQAIIYNQVYEDGKYNTSL